MPVLLLASSQFQVHRLLQDRVPVQDDDADSRLTLRLLGLKVCGVAWRKLVGIGQNSFFRLLRAVKAKKAAPVDGRFVKRKKLLLKGSAVRERIVEFLEELYHTAAEPTPVTTALHDEPEEAVEDRLEFRAMRFRRPQGRRPKQDLKLPDARKLRKLDT